MRSKLFLSFFLIILILLVSNLIYGRYILKDFDEYVEGTKEDHLYWVLASVEGSKTHSGWDIGSLNNTFHWAMMLGLDAIVNDVDGNSIASSHGAFNNLSPSMKNRMESVIHPHTPAGEYEEYPLYLNAEEIGYLYVRPLSSEGLSRKKELLFKKRGQDFLLISFVIAGSGALLLSIFFSMFLTGPVRRLKVAAKSVADGNLTVRVKSEAKDEIGMLANTFNHMVETLEREENLRKHLSGNIAHELRTPLAVMKANVEGMLDGVVKTDNESIETLRTEVERLIGLVEGIEDITKAEASFFKKLEYEEINMREFLEGIMKSMTPLFIGKNISLSLASSENIKVVADAGKLERVLRNILSNSLRHTHTGGIEVSYGKDSNNIFIEIKDTGEGISGDDLTKIFDRFFRGQGSNGIGLGLSIVRELVEVMNGKVEVKSKLGEGTVFRVILPVKVR